jgi:hypothetical protein
VVLGEDVEGVIVAVFADQVSGTFGEEPGRVLVGAVGTGAGSVLHHRHDLDRGGRNLKQRWDSPCPVGRNGHRPQAHGCRDDLADEVGGVEQRGENRSFLGVTQLSQQR